MKTQTQPVTHTPGPWKLSTFTETSVMAGHGDEQTTVAQAQSDILGTDAAAANARLIASSPDLLAALEECESDVRQRAMPDLAMIRKAIAAAKGVA